MKITKIKSIGTKGSNLDQALTGRDVFVGPNGSGKTTRLQSAMIAVLGYIPGEGKSLNDTFGISSEKEMSVTVETDTGFTCTRSIKSKSTRNKATGSKTYSLSGSTDIFPPKGEKTETSKKDRISEEFGMSSDLFDIGEFLNKSDEKKREFIFSLTNPSDFGWDKERVFSEISNSYDNKETIKTLEAIWDDNESLQDNTSRMASWTKEQLSDVKKEFKSAKEAKKALLIQKQELEATPKELNVIKEQLVVARKEIEEIAGEIAGNKEKTRMMSAIKSRINDLERKIDVLLNEPSDVISLREELNVEIKKLGEANETVSRLREKRTEISLTIAGLKSERKMLTDKASTINDSKGICPLTDEECTTSDSLESANELIEKRIKELDELILGRSTMIKETDSIGTDAGSTAKSIDDRIDTIRSTIHKSELAAKDKEIRVSDIAELDKANREIAEMNISDILMLETTMTGLKTREASLIVESEKAQEVNDLYKSFDKSKMDAIELEEKVDDLEDLISLLGTGQIQGMMLKDTVSPLIEKINDLLVKANQIYNMKIDLYDKNNKPIFDLSWEKGDKEIPFEALSGGERAIFGVALLYAVIMAKNPPLKMICLEASEIDKINLDMLLSNINEIADDINNILIATHVNPDKCEGWEIHNL